MKLVKQSNGMEMRKETGNHRIKGSQDIPSIIIMSDTNGSKRTDHGAIPRSGRGGLSLDNRASQVVIKRNPCQKIGTWNVRSLFHPGKLENTVTEMKRLELNILGVSDVQWPGSGKCKTNHGEFYYSGNEDPTHRQGVGILVDNKYQKAVCSFVPFSDRVMMLSFNSKPKRKINFIQVYAPTADKDEQEVESFYHQIKDVMKLTKRHDINILMGDFNAKVGAGEVEGCVGHYGLGERNERGERLVEFCQSEELVIANTLFKQPKRRLYTWRSPADSEDRIVRNQIDFIAINKRYRNSVISTKTYPGADIYSDHNPVVSVLRIRLKNVERNVKAQIMDPKRLKEHNTYCETKEKINEALKHTKREIAELRGVDNKWEHLRDVLMSVGKQTIKPMREKRKPWMTEEILDMMEARRLEKTTNVIRYKEIHRTIVKATRQAKEKWLSDKCKEIEVLDRKYDSFNVHKKIKEMTGGQKPRFPGLLRTSDGRLIADAKEKLLLWTNYIRELFQDERTEPSLDNTEDTGPSILRQEVLYAIRNTKSGKATGPDELPIELLKLIEEELIDVLVDLFNLIYETGTIPTMWLQSTFVAIPKKTGAITCAEHRTIALMSHTLKAFLKIIHGRICRTLECDISDTQFGLRNGMGTREALFGLNVLAQRCMDMNQDLYVCYIDFEKAFDTVQHEKLLEILKDKNIDSRNITIISQLYWNQTARMKVDEHLTPDIAIQKGVRQGCVLSPLLFNVYSEAVFQQTFSDCSEGITINGEVLNNLRFADDTAIIANNIDDLQSMMQRLNMCCKEYGLKMNLKKTKYMIISKTTITNIRLSIEHTEIERVEKYKYLGTWITSNVDQSKEIKARVEVARSTFIKLKKFFTCRDMSLELRMRMLRCYVFSVLLYGLEAWTLKEVHMNKLAAFELWCYRRILRISWMEKVTNLEVIRRMGNEPEILKTIKRRKLEYLGHVMRGQKYALLQLIIQGKIQGRRSVGRRKISWLKNLRTWFGCSSIELFRAVANKVRIATMISNLR